MTRATASTFFALTSCVALTTASAATTSLDEAHRVGAIVVIGVDGMSFDVLDPLLDAGELPALAHLVEGGARAVLTSERPMRSPALWTTIATGQPRKKHEIYDFITGSHYWPKSQRGNEQKLVTSQMRKSPALWQLAGDAGLRSLVVGWLNTWPAESIRGVMVAPYVALGQSRQTSIKGKIYGDAQRQTYPPEAFDRLRGLVVNADAVDPALIAEIVDAPPHDSPLYTAIPRLKRYLYTVRWSIAGTLTNTAIVEDELGRRRDTDLVMTYFDGADTLGHRFWMMREPIAAMAARLEAHGMNGEHAAELKRRFGGAVDGYYRLLDRAVSRIVAAAGPEATILIVSDHGWGGSGRVRAAYDTVPFDGEHRMEGVLIAHGPHIKPGRLAPLTLYEVAPTVLYMLGAGVPKAMPGRVALEMIDDQFVAAHPPLLLAGEQPRRRPDAEAKAGAAPYSDVEIERLRSLGYVQ
jgi:predicted AlkP superfamily phosphohydrolase/phosphomutase